MKKIIFLALLLIGCAQGRYFQVVDPNGSLHLQVEYSGYMECASILNHFYDIGMGEYSTCSNSPSINLPFNASVRTVKGFILHINAIDMQTCQKVVTAFMATKPDCVVKECH